MQRPQDAGFNSSKPGPRPQRDPCCGALSSRIWVTRELWTVLVGHRNQLARTCKRHGAVTSRRKLNGKREWRRVMQLYGSSRCRTPTLLLSRTGKKGNGRSGEGRGNSLLPAEEQDAVHTPCCTRFVRCAYAPFASYASSINFSLIIIYLLLGFVYIVCLGVFTCIYCMLFTIFNNCSLFAFGFRFRFRLRFPLLLIRIVDSYSYQLWLGNCNLRYCVPLLFN